MTPTLTRREEEEEPKEESEKWGLENQMANYKGDVMEVRKAECWREWSHPLLNAEFVPLRREQCFVKLAPDSRMSLTELKQYHSLADVWLKNECEAQFWAIRYKDKCIRDFSENSSFLIIESNRKLVSVSPIGCK